MVTGTTLLPRLMAAAVLAVAGLCAAPAAPSQPCPDIGVAFARGTGEPPGPGIVGQRFVDALRAQTFPRTVGVHGVNYPAARHFGDGLAFARNVVDGVRDEVNHVHGVLSICPHTKMVLGGYSQGAAVTALATSGRVPAGVDPAASPGAISATLAEHVAAVVLFGKPAGPSMVKYGVPNLDVGPGFAEKSLEFCNPGDPVCSGGLGAGLPGAHGAYAAGVLPEQAAAFVVSRLDAGADVN